MTRPPTKRKRSKPAPAKPDATDRSEQARAFAIEAARTLEDDKCTDIVVLDARSQSQMTDFIVIASGTSERQMRSVLTHVEELGEANAFRAFRSSTDERATWLLADFVDVVVHVFEPNTRAFYDLEMLWGDAPRVRWQRRRTAIKSAAQG